MGNNFEQDIEDLKRQLNNKTDEHERLKVDLYAWESFANDRDAALKSMHSRFTSLELENENLKVEIADLQSPSNLMKDDRGHYTMEFIWLTIVSLGLLVHTTQLPHLLKLHADFFLSNFSSVGFELCHQQLSEWRLALGVMAAAHAARERAIVDLSILFLLINYKR